MNRKMLYATLFLLSLTVKTAYTGDLLDGGPKIDTPASQSDELHRKLTGEVDRIEGDMVFLKTEEGTVRNFGVKEAKKEGLKGLKPGDRITIELDEGNEIADIHKEAQMAEGDQSGADSPEGKGGASPDKHRSITGTIEFFDAMEKKVTLKTKEGKSQSFELKNPAISKLTGVAPGTEVTLEIDEQNRVMDAHKPS